MTVPDLHQLRSDVEKLRADFEKHLAVESVHREAEQEWRDEISKRTTEMYQILTEGKQSWKTILFAGSVVVGGFSFVAWLVNFFIQIKSMLGASGK